jgi:PAS domain S-box-containing protein
LGEQRLESRGIVDGALPFVNIPSSQWVEFAFEHAWSAHVLMDPEKRIHHVNAALERLTGYSREELRGTNFLLLLSNDHNTPSVDGAWESISKQETWKGAIQVLHKDGPSVTVEAVISPLYNYTHELVGISCSAQQVSDPADRDTQLLHALKMEAVGELASGIAHEINTPIQYVGDNIRFFHETVTDLLGLLRLNGQLALSIKSGAPSTELVQEIETYTKKIDLEYLEQEIPAAISQSLEGIERIAVIVRAMKEFAHPGAEEMIATDINRVIENTVSVARNEWKYVADVETDLDPALPMVTCLPGSISQALLNLLVNAAHAIEDAIGADHSNKGTIRMTTRSQDGYVEVCVSDTGTGIPVAIQSRVFDPFFTTKKVGRGTGQGLASVHYVVVKTHQGAVTFETEVGKGTTFIVRLPIRPASE